jgi:hypothetical protein
VRVALTVVGEARFLARPLLTCSLSRVLQSLEAEASGIRGTGIGCFFDEEVHAVVGLRDEAWRCLYGFTIGGPVEDPRIRTLPPDGA